MVDQLAPGTRAAGNLPLAEVWAFLHQVRRPLWTASMRDQAVAPSWVQYKPATLPALAVTG